MLCVPKAISYNTTFMYTLLSTQVLHEVSNLQSLREERPYDVVGNIDQHRRIDDMECSEPQWKAFLHKIDNRTPLVEG